MNESLSGFVVSAVEFIIGGMLLIAASAFLYTGLPWVDYNLSNVSVFFSPRYSQLGVIVILTGLAYATGVVGESVCRIAMEHDLVRVTRSMTEFEPRKKSLRRADAVSAEGQESLGAAARKENEAKLVKLYVDEREHMRTIVMTKHFRLHAEVESQLKRLRLERVCCAAVGIAAVGFALRRDWFDLGLFAVSASGLRWMVHLRFGRYCRSIARGYRAIADRKLTMTAPGVKADAALDDASQSAGDRDFPPPGRQA